MAAERVEGRDVLHRHPTAYHIYNTTIHDILLERNLACIFFSVTV